MEISMKDMNQLRSNVEVGFARAVEIHSALMVKYKMIVSNLIPQEMMQTVKA